MSRRALDSLRQTLSSSVAPFARVFQVGQTNIAKRADRQAVREARFAITPLLQAEEDLRYVEARRSGRVPPSPYKTPTLWAPPTNANGY